MLTTIILSITTGGLLPVGIILIIGLLAAGKPKKAKAATRPREDCTPFPWLEERVDDAIERSLSEGVIDPERLTVNACREVYPTSPDGKDTTWPEPEGGDDSKLCIQDRVRIRVDLRLAQLAEEQAKEAEKADLPEPEAPKTIPEIIVENEPVAGDGNKYPMPGSFYRVNPPGTSPLTGGDPENLAVIAQAALMNALQIAELDPDLARGEMGQRLRTQMISLIECSPWNDPLYGHEEAHHYAQHNRGISLNAVHADNRARMIRGKKPRRAVTGLESHDGTGGHLPYLWIPAIDPVALELGEVMAIDNFWPDGSSGSWPPPEIKNLSGENVPRGPWGCDGELFPRA